MFNKLYNYRFEIFFFSQIATLFGSLIIAGDLFEKIVEPILFQTNILAGILLLYKNKKTIWFFVSLLVISAIVFGLNFVDNRIGQIDDYVRMTTYFLFFVIVTIEIIKQVLNSKIINKNVILGLISGYISIGFVGFLIFLSIELIVPNSFKGLNETNTNIEIISEELMYYSYITMSTIGFGDISPITPLTRKASLLLGLIGQMYLVIITATVVGKYINQFSQKDK